MRERVSNKERTFTALQKLLSGIKSDANNANSCTNCLASDDGGDDDDDSNVIKRCRDLAFVSVLSRDGEE